MHPADEARIYNLNQRWSSALALWALPEFVTTTAPISNFKLDPSRFVPRPLQKGDIRVDLIRKFVSQQGRTGAQNLRLIDIGAAAGSSLGVIHELFNHIAAVEANPDMALALQDNLEKLREDNTFSIYQAQFPTSLDGLSPADVVNASNVVYNVSDLLSFLRTLDQLATGLVAVEATLHHPFYSSNDAFQYFWGIERPTSPTAADIFELARALGYEASMASYPSTYQRTTTSPESLMTRLGLNKERLPEIITYIDRFPPPHNPSILIWWPSTSL